MFNFVTLKEFSEKSMFLKIAAQEFEVGDFLNIFLKFCSFWSTFSFKIFLIKKCLQEELSHNFSRNQ